MARTLGPSALPGGWGWKARCVHGKERTNKKVLTRLTEIVGNRQSVRLGNAM
jgi:hypothetical protein